MTEECGHLFLLFFIFLWGPKESGEDKKTAWKFGTFSFFALTNGSRFVKDKSFEELNPVYDVTPYDIQEYIKQKLLENKETQ